MEPNHPTKFFLYVLFAIAMGMSIFLVDLYLSDGHASSYAAKADMHDRENYWEKTSDEPAEMNAPVDVENLKFKPFVKLKPQFKSEDTASISSDSQADHVEDENTMEQLAAVTTPEVKKSSPKTSTASYFEQLKESYSKNVLSKIPAGDIRRDIIIRYYTHEADGNKVYKLRKLGFYIHERPVESGLDNYESNAVFYGDNVSEEDLKIVVYTLVKAGMPIKKISLSKYHDGWKASSIEIGTDVLSTDLPIYTPERIQKLKL